MLGRHTIGWSANPSLGNSQKPRPTMEDEIVEIDDDSDIEITFETAPVPKPLPPRFAFPPYQPVPHVRRQRDTFFPKPCSFCRREFRDKVTVARHTVSGHGRAGDDAVQCGEMRVNTCWYTVQCVFKLQKKLMLMCMLSGEADG